MSSSGWRRRNRARSAKTKFEDMDVERSQPSTVIKKNSDTRVYADEPSMWSAGESYRWPGGMSTRKGLDSAAVAMGEQELTPRSSTRTPAIRACCRAPACS